MSLRALVFGFCIAVAVSLLESTSRYILKGSYLADGVMPMGSLLLCLLSILGCALLARGFGRRFVFSPSEWITVFCMGFVSSVTPTYWVSGYLVSLMAAPYYFATTENRWAEHLHPTLPAWLIPSNDGRAMTWFFEGLPPGGAIPWGVWILPFFWWFTFIGVLGFACICASVLFHRQWADHERLVYPALTPILEMTTRAGTGRRALPEFMQGGVFWSGFGLTTLVFWWNMISWFYPGVPTFPTASGTFYWDLLPKNYPPLFFFVNTYVICFSYFASLDVLFSLWFFDLLYILEAGILNRVGIVATSPHYGAGPYTTTHYKWQTAGAFVTLVLWGLWIARRHLREVFRKALHPGRSAIDDSRELLSYRVAVIGLVVSCLYIAAWLGQVGVEARMVALLIPAMFITYLFVAKVQADSGLIYVNTPASAWELTQGVLGGTRALKASTRATYGLLSFTVNHPRSFILPMVAHIHRLSDFVTQHKRRLFWGVCAAFVAGVTVSTFYTIWLGYRVGGANFEPNWLIIHEGEWQYEMTVSAILNPRPMETVNAWLFLAGAAGVSLLNLMRYRFVWWPFHPLGFALSGISSVRLAASTLLLAWLVKLAMLKFGGASFYRRSGPFFVGMLIGYILAVFAGLLVDVVWFPKQGHIVHRWY